MTGATAYDVRTDGASIIETMPDHLASGFDYSSVHKFEVRAKNAMDVSDWSPEFAAVTRPPTPDMPKQDDSKPTVFGVALQWDSSGADPMGLGAYIGLWRKLDGTEERLNRSPLQLMDGFLDESDPSMKAKNYWLKIVVPNANIPGNPMPGDNESFPSRSITVTGPNFRKAVASLLPLLRQSDNLRRRYFGGGF